MEQRVSLRSYSIVFLSSLLLWVLLTGSLATEELLAGLLVALVVSAVSRQQLGVFNGLILSPRAFLFLIAYLVYFFYALLRANFDLAGRVLSPSLPIRPGFVEVRTGLTSSLGRMLLANSITLTPGTLTVELQEERLLVHWINVPEEADRQAVTEAVAGGFERWISGFLK